MKITLLLVIMTCMTRFSFSQTYTGLFYASNTGGMHTDSYFNLIPNSGATSINSWNIYHQDGSSLFSVLFAAAQPSIQVGMAKSTNFYVNGNVGISTSTPRGQFDAAGTGDIYLVNNPIAGTAQTLYLPGHIFISPYNGSDWSYFQARRFDSSGSTNFQFRTWNAGSLTDAMVIRSNGNVGIGSYNPDQKLTVKGIVHAQEVRVDLSVPGPDYVFEKSYKLRTLEEIKTYIDQNKRLPEVPSAAEMEKNGVQLGEMNMLLLKKVEELTLYVVDLKKENDHLKSRLDKIENDKSNSVCR